MSTHSISPDITFAPEHEGGTKIIWKTFWILSFLTILELGIGLLLYNMHKGDAPSPILVLAFKGLVCVLTLAKAFYIVATFMHLGNELRNFIMTIIVTLGLFVWFIIAFLWDGSSWREMRNTNAGSIKYQKEQKAAPAMKQGEKE